VSIYRQGPSPAGSCPRCRDTLIAVSAGEIVPGVRTCHKCGGVFADNDASRKIVSTLDRVLLEIGFQAAFGRRRERDPRELARSLTCPECLIGMRKVRIESAACEIDVCPAHGTWFDAGELQDVMRAYASSRKAGTLSPGRPPLTATDAALSDVAKASAVYAEPTLIEMVNDNLRRDD
jgi:Zn-finger nucleic acid-binding protein